MSGRSNVQYKLVRIAFPLFAVNPDFESASITESERHWDVVCDMDAHHFNKEWDKVAMKITVTLRLNATRQKVAELITRTTYQVTPGLDMKEKMIVFSLLIKQTLGHAQGAWMVKNTNHEIAKCIPQGPEVYPVDHPGFLQVIKGKWQI